MTPTPPDSPAASPAASQAVERVTKLRDFYQTTVTGRGYSWATSRQMAAALTEVLAALASAERASREAKDRAADAPEAEKRLREFFAGWPTKFQSRDVETVLAQLDTLRASLAEAIKERDSLRLRLDELYSLSQGGQP